MIMLDTMIEGKQTRFAQMQDCCKIIGFTLGGNWEYYQGYYDAILAKDSDETIYLRLPFIVAQGMLDHLDALIEFEKPYIIKHVINLGLDRDENSLVSATGFNQFQKPLDTDGNIDNKSYWKDAGEDVVHYVVESLLFKA